jgi:hypothetical protein
MTLEAGREPVQEALPISSRVGHVAAATIALFAILAIGCDAARVVDGWEFDGVTGCADTPFGGDNTVP